jgi:hypothetical protein
VLVEVSAPRGDLALEIGGSVDDGHDILSEVNSWTREGALARLTIRPGPRGQPGGLAFSKHVPASRQRRGAPVEAPLAGLAARNGRR